NNSTVSGNTANRYGGGIYNRGNAANAAILTLNNSTVSGNTANRNGGGIYNTGLDVANAATLTLNNSTVSGNTAFASNLQVKVTDEFNNVVPNVTVTLIPLTTGAGITLDNISLITNEQGIATTTVTANTTAGDYQVAAGVEGVANFTGGNFNLTNNPGAAAILNILTGNNQSADVNSVFADNLQIQVTDEFGNVVPGATVTFTAPGTGASASFDSTSLVTDAEGLVTITATANSIGGNYQVGANVIGVTEINFDLTNIAAPVVVVPDNSTPVVVVPDNSTPSIPNFTPIWQSVLEELPEYGLEESACTTTPAVVIDSTAEEITLDEAIATAIQRNQDCQPAGIEN
ncbi:MAG: hypothetical protein F6K47_43830, partial [Symploca sp. SIO2E6]|nr:hypothetical protein [Symploca sp. SIO2E6]